MDKRTWGLENPLRQFSVLDGGLIQKLERANLTIDKVRVHVLFFVVVALDQNIVCCCMSAVAWNTMLLGSLSHHMGVDGHVQMRDMSPADIGHMVHHVRMGQKIKTLVQQFPTLKLHVALQPITRTVLRVTLVIEPQFNCTYLTLP